MMHLLRKYDVAPLRAAMMRCLPQCAVRHTSFASAFIIGRSPHHLPKANIIQKTHLCLGRQKCVFCWRRRRDLKRRCRPLVEIVVSLPYRSRYSFSPPIPPSFLHPPGALRAGCPCRNRQGSNLDFADEKIGQTEWSVLFFGGEGEI